MVGCEIFSGNDTPVVAMPFVMKTANDVVKSIALSFAIRRISCGVASDIKCLPWSTQRHDVSVLAIEQSVLLFLSWVFGKL